jgi:hypothetical protein
MSYLSLNDYYKAVVEGAITDKTMNHKFGRAVLSTSFGPVCFGGDLQMPQPAAATALRIKAGGDANDAAAGTGAREVTLQGVDASGDHISEAVATAGASASSPTSASFIRLYRFYVSSAGAYAAATGGGHVGDIVIENSAGGTDWGTIDSTNEPRGQSEVAYYCVPTGKKAYIVDISATVDATKTTDLLLFKRDTVLDAAAPYESPRLQLSLIGLDSDIHRQFKAPLGPYAANTDLWWLGKASATATVEVQMQILEEPA